jgi:hypothetical protein
MLINPITVLWNGDETRVGSPKQAVPPNTMAAVSTKPGTVTVPEEKTDVQLTLITAISALGDSTIPMPISTNKTFDKVSLAAQQLFEGHDYTSRAAEKTFITEMLSIDWSQNVFLPRVSHLRERTKYQGKAVLVLDGHATHVTPRVVAYAGSPGLSLIPFVSHSSHVAQLLDLCVFGLFKTIYYKERKSKVMKRETMKMYHALLAIYKATIIPMVRWSFERAGFLLDLENIRDPV